MIKRKYSVACVSVPRSDGNGALGCGRGWVQDAGISPLICEVCGRNLTITGTYLEIQLRETK